MELELKMTSPAKRIVPKCIKVHHSRVRPALSKNIVYCTYNYVVELFGSSLPFLVSESLTYTPGAKDFASANLNPEISWAWYVCGRRLLCWYIPSLTDTLMPVFAREMELPLTVLANNANCVYIFPGLIERSPSCIAVSPEGVVRYWIVLGPERYVDLDANLDSEEVCEVKYLPPLGCLAVTTSGTMVLITPVMVRNEPTVRIKKITGASGWLISIGKKIGSLFFGKSQSLAFKSVRTLTSLKGDAQWRIFLLAGFTFQSWSIEIRNSISHLIFETNIENIIRRAFPDQVWYDPENEILITDIKHSEAGGIIILAASNKPRFYIIVELDGDYITPPTHAARLCILNRSNMTLFEDESGEIPPLRFLLLPESALVFNRFILYGVPFSGGNEVEGELLELPGGFALGSLMYKKTPIFCSGRHGFVSVTPANTSSIDILNTAVIKESSVPSIIAKREAAVSISLNDIARLKIAFVHFVRKNYERCFKLISEEFPTPSDIVPVNTLLARTLVKLSFEIINDLSPLENRWIGVMTDFPFKGQTPRDMHVNAKVAEKLHAHDIFLKFARRLGTITKLGYIITPGNTLVRTENIIYEHNEKVTTLYALRKHQKRDLEGIIRDLAIDVVQTLGLEYSTMGISPADYFYNFGSIADIAIRRLITNCMDVVGSHQAGHGYLPVLKKTTAVLIAILRVIIRKRERRGYYVDTTYIPWLLAPQPGLFTEILALVQLNFNVIKLLGDRWNRIEYLMTQFYHLSYYLLSLRQPYMLKEEFDEVTSPFINFFIEKNMMDEALRLAYKYKNFDFLVSITSRLSLDHSVSDYIDDFRKEGYCVALFKVLHSLKRYQELFDQILSEEDEIQLRNFLSNIPELNWLYCVKRNDFAGANDILLSFINHPSFSAKDQEMICIFSRMMCSAGFLPENREIDNLLKRSLIQKCIPGDMFMQKGYDPETTKVLSPVELIQVLTGGEDYENREVFFKKALEVADLMDEEIKEVTKMEVWATAISEDKWNLDYELDIPEEIFDEEFLTFRLMTVLKQSGEKKVSTFKVPTINEIISGKHLENDERVDILRNNSLNRSIYQYRYEKIIGSTSKNSDNEVEEFVSYNDDENHEENDGGIYEESSDEENFEDAIDIIG